MEISGTIISIKISKYSINAAFFQSLNIKNLTKNDNTITLN